MGGHGFSHGGLQEDPAQAKAGKPFAPDSEMPYYLTYCPMAFDFKGAFWLQTSDIVDNSYFGEAMLRCGEIKQTLVWENGGDE